MGKIQDDIKTIAHHYGLSSQLKKLAEECCELAQAALKSEQDYGYVDHMVEEIADVEIMIAQIKELFPISMAYEEEIVKKKLDRQLGRMMQEKREG